eukprot:Gb_22186 [translate_table: standard]
MATALLDPTCDQSSSSAEEYDYLKGVTHLAKSGNLNSVPDKYILPPNKRPSASDIAEDENIPIVDVSDLEGSQQQRLQAIHTVGRACAEWGFFRVINHGIQESLLENMLDVAHQFFALPLDEKMKYSSKDLMNPVSYGTSFNATAEEVLCWRDYLKHFGYPALQTPDNPPTYKDVAVDYTKEIRKLALRLMAAISQSLGLESNYIESAFKGGLQIVVVNMYPECPEPHLAMGVPPHSDDGGLTILLQNDVGGLQVRYNDRWVAVEPIPNSFVVNVGDHLEILSNGRCKGVEHRAVVNTKTSRISIAVANGPSMDALIFPCPQLIDENHPPIYKAMTYGEFLRHQQGTQLRGKGMLELLKLSEQQV